MHGTIFRLPLATAALGLSGLLPMAGALAHDPPRLFGVDRTVRITALFDIPAQPLAQALRQFAEQAGVQLAFETLLTQGRASPSVKGEFSRDEALTRLLEGTGLRYEYLDPRTIAVAPASRASTTNAAQAGALRFALADDVMPISGEAGIANAYAAGSTQKGSETLEEITVTAQKRGEERLQDVPVPVTVLRADTLVDSSQFQLKDYYSKIPGMTFTWSDFNSPVLTLRGLSTGGTYVNSTVGASIDDVPFGGSVLNTGGSSVPDVDPSDLAQLEILRGPQGTLYGASGLGGLLKYVTVDPKIDGLTGQVQAGAASVARSRDFGYQVRGSVNVPVSETLALRASGFSRRDPGYIDNVETGRHDQNSNDVVGGRVATLWSPSDSLSLKLSALYQKTQSDGSSNVDLEPGLGDYENTQLRGTGTFIHDLWALSANLAAKLGGGELQFISGYSNNDTRVTFDADWADFFAQQISPAAQAGFPAAFRTEKLSQELRWSMPLGERIDWMVGAFHTHEQGFENSSVYAANAATGQPIDAFYRVSVSGRFEEYAWFSNMTFEINDRFDIQVGGRASRNRSAAHRAQISDPFGSNSIPEKKASDEAFTYLVTPRFRVSPDLMLYARIASGYRPGSVNLSTVDEVPVRYTADTTQNYELGIKGSFFGRALSVDASLYRIDWTDIQVFGRDTTVSTAPFYTNGGRARSQGVELSVQWRPLPGTSVSSWVAWNEAKLGEAFSASNPQYGLKGDRLPYSTPLSGSVSIDQSFPLASAASGFIGGSVDYVGERKDVFSSRNEAGLPAQPRLSFPAYAKVDMQAGVKIESWTAKLYVNNVLDRLGVLSGGFRAPYGFYNVIPPRTVGVNVSRTF